MLRFFKKKPEIKNQAVFGEAAAKHGEHGAIVGTWIKEGYHQPATISFYFLTNGHCPRLSEDLMEQLFHQARMAGIEPSHLYSYAGLANSKRSHH